MKKFLVVLEYELKEYVRSKGFVLTTLLIAVLGAGILFLPRIVNMSGLLGTGPKQEAPVPEDESSKDKEDDEKADQTLLLYDEAGVMNMDLLKSLFPDSVWEAAADEDVIRERVQSGEVAAGFIVRSATQYDYYVLNKGMGDENKARFETAMTTVARQKYCEDNGLDYDEVEALFSQQIVSNDLVLGKDSGQNYWYSYALVILVFMLIVFYGQMIAVSVTNEKSNRSIEVLVTTTTPNSLLFGKVIAGAIASLCQVGLIMGSILISYAVNRDVWGGMLDMIFMIPGSVLITFAFFGLGGFLFYAFLYGAVGALVSKTEDISKSSGGLMMLIMIVYFIVLFQLTNVDGVAMKVLSFLPFSSYSAMFVRIAMGSVQVWEVIVSYVILLASIFGAGFLGARIYRMGTLRYGNPIKFTTALKDMKKSN
ncbi:ABC transporter permease [Anaerolentibacter hominis]|uniref:ABC transporter permease n=1 Tax=Anaerolentibacter hominis TaxID=3079009 RepID=UPI0031B80FE6